MVINNERGVHMERTTQTTRYKDFTGESVMRQARKVIVTLRCGDMETTKTVWSDDIAEHMQEWQELFWRIVWIDYK